MNRNWSLCECRPTIALQIDCPFESQGDGGLMKMVATGRVELFQCSLRAAIRGNRKLEAYATWGMLPACLPSHRQRVAPQHLTKIFITRVDGGSSADIAWWLARQDSRTIGLGDCRRRVLDV